MFGVIGLGNMGKNHARIYSELKCLGTVYDTDKDRVNYYSKLYNIPPSYSLEELFDNKDLLGVSVVTPTPYHKEVAIKCLEAGLDVLLEKPMTDNLLDAADLVDVAKLSENNLSVGYIEKYNPVFRALCRLVEQRDFGDLTSVNIKRVGGMPQSADNVILDLMTHDFSLLLDLFKKQPETINTHTHYNEEVLDSAQVLLDFGTASATCEANWLTPVKIRSIQLTGTNGYCEVDLINQTLTSFLPLASHLPNKVSSYIKKVIQFRGEPLKVEIEAFIKRDKPILTSAQEAFSILDLTLKAINS